MNNIAILGIGNCGSQIANLAEQKYPELFTSMYINSSEADLAMVKSETSLKFKIGEKGKVEGSGKNREKMKDFLEQAIVSIIRNEQLAKTIYECKYCFICASTAGGTGSGSAPLMMQFLRSMYPQRHFILVGVLPKLHASMLELGNSLEFLQELYGPLSSDNRVTYMVYDNETVSDLPPTVGLSKVNAEIVEDIRVLTGINCFATPYDSIDDADMESIITTPGRLLVTRIPADNKDTSILTEKNMEDCDLGEALIKAIKKSAHTEIDRNHRTVRRGIITYLTPEVNNLYNPDLTKLDEFLGTPIEKFEHNAINPNKETFNFIDVINSGLSPINDRSTKIKDRMEELQNALPKENDYILNDVNISTSGMRNTMDPDAPSMNDIDTEAIFNRFRNKK